MPLFRCGVCNAAISSIRTEHVDVRQEDRMLRCRMETVATPMGIRNIPTGNPEAEPVGELFHHELRQEMKCPVCQSTLSRSARHGTLNVTVELSRTEREAMESALTMEPNNDNPTMPSTTLDRRVKVRRVDGGIMYEKGETPRLMRCPKCGKRWTRQDMKFTAAETENGIELAVTCVCGQTVTAKDAVTLKRKGEKDDDKG